ATTAVERGWLAAALSAGGARCPGRRRGLSETEPAVRRGDSSPAERHGMGHGGTPYAALGGSGAARVGLAHRLN
ncbi:MAG TPA: hypothetical protein VNL71_04700, partial [Chloroflexota bacterium]|nr:hypothetical protein [Chloroflexota bacterium]